MKVSINYGFERDTHTMIKEFSKEKTGMFAGYSTEKEMLGAWLKSINELGFFEAQTEKGPTLVPVRNINFIKIG
jgi:hypothetical protein